MKCIVCAKEIPLVWEGKENLEYGSGFVIQCDYGSNFDMDQYHAAVCDTCLEKAIETNCAVKIGEMQFKNVIIDGQE
jgi:hypothetical protein